MRSKLFSTVTVELLATGDALDARSRLPAAIKSLAKFNHRAEI